MTWKPFPVPNEFKDGRKFFAAQDGEVYVAKYVTDTVPPQIVFRQHRNRVDRRYYYANLDLGFIGFPARISRMEPVTEEFEHIWRTETRGFVFNPTHWASYEEPPK